MKSIDTLDVFLKGEITDLCIPTEDYALNSDWYSMFNDAKITQYLDHGLYPNTPLKQLEFLRNANKSNRIVLIISDKNQYIGVISLTVTELVKGIGSMAIVINKEKNLLHAPFIALEAISLLTTHAFEVIGLKRIESGHNEELYNWQFAKEILGYRLEGIERNKARQGNKINNSILSSITIEDFKKIVSIRGNLWDNYKKMQDRFLKHKANSKKSFYAYLINEVMPIWSEYYGKINYY